MCLAWEGEGGRGNGRSGMARLGERGGGREETWWVARKSEERALHVKAAHHKANRVTNFKIDQEEIQLMWDKIWKT